MSCSCLCENTLLMWEVRGKWPHWFRLVESGCVITCQTMKQKTTPGATLVKSASVACFPIIRMVSLDWSPFCIVADHIYSFMCSSSDGIFQQDNAPCYKARIISSCEWSSLSPDLNTRATLGCGGTENSLLGCATTVWCCHINIDQNLPGIFVTSMPRIIKPVLCTYISQMVH